MRKKIAEMEKYLSLANRVYAEEQPPRGDKLTRDAAKAAIREAKGELERLRDLLARLTVECAAESGNLSTPGATDPPCLRA